MYMYVCQHACTVCVFLLFSEARTGLFDPLKLELWLFMRHPVDSENQTQVLHKSINCS